MFVRTELVTVDSVNASARMRTHILEEEEKETEVGGRGGEVELVVEVVLKVKAYSER